VAAYVERITQEIGFDTKFELAHRGEWAFVKVTTSARQS
jgi:hypothetical protein